MDNLSFRLNGNEYRKLNRYCNKPTCKCHEGNPHGPYWYKNNIKYIGKVLTPEILNSLHDIDQNKYLAMDAKNNALDQIRVLKSELQALKDQITSFDNFIDNNYISPIDFDNLTIFAAIPDKVVDQIRKT